MVIAVNTDITASRRKSRGGSRGGSFWVRSEKVSRIRFNVPCSKFNVISRAYQSLAQFYHYLSQRLKEDTMKIERFEDIESWKEARNVVRDVYKIMKSCKDFGFKDQMQRASISIMSNIAEGFDREATKSSSNF
jgi:hypothetical protein